MLTYTFSAFADSQKYIVIPQPSEAKGAWGLQTPGNVFAGDHPLLQVCLVLHVLQLGKARCLVRIELAPNASIFYLVV